MSCPQGKSDFILSENMYQVKYKTNCFLDSDFSKKSILVTND